MAALAAMGAPPRAVQSAGEESPFFPSVKGLSDLGKDLERLGWGATSARSASTTCESSPKSAFRRNRGSSFTADEQSTDSGSPRRLCRASSGSPSDGSAGSEAQAAAAERCALDEADEDEDEEERWSKDQETALREAAMKVVCGAGTQGYTPSSGDSKRGPKSMLAQGLRPKEPARLAQGRAPSPPRALLAPPEATHRVPLPPGCVQAGSPMSKKYGEWLVPPGYIRPASVQVLAGPMLPEDPCHLSVPLGSIFLPPPNANDRPLKVSMAQYCCEPIRLDPRMPAKKRPTLF